MGNILLPSLEAGICEGLCFSPQAVEMEPRTGPGLCQEGSFLRKNVAGQ